MAAEIDTTELPDERFSLLINLAQTQVLAQTIHSDNYDLRLVGLLGFNGALIVVDFAVKDSLLGGRWWVPLIFLAASSFLCLWSPDSKEAGGSRPAASASSGEDPVGDVSDLGPSPRAFFMENRTKSPPRFQAQLLADLSQTLGDNEWSIDRKKQHLVWAGYFLAGAVASGAIVALGLQNIVGWADWEIEVSGVLAVAAWHWFAPTLASFTGWADRLAGIVWRHLREIVG